MPTNLILLIAALLVSFLVFRWLFTVIKSSATTAISIAVIVLLLQLGFGISPQKLWNEITSLPQSIQQLFQK
ncbi:hypothetical protein VB715_01535 [Crocosphaera sp. UHCC 0190]|uniref:hypothetical protein n=1 Tax=Crocosphaera sp. UHCC 0190 TaxID=3110246 RepID=UPI002B1FF31F|nr:hypothetical protein [Crocosphaera sp. UHCC 0190]MEA5508437.1 hypothetical protein [Crocosphaera sp. UHCC 0190]